VKTVVVMLKPEAARAMHAAPAGTSGGAPAAVSELTELMAQLGLELVPTHPSATHEMLLPYFSIAVSADEQADSVASRLRANRFVDSAYVQPSPSLA
jgi:hypothetical protein